MVIQQCLLLFMHFFLLLTGSLNSAQTTSRLSYGVSLPWQSRKSKYIAFNICYKEVGMCDRLFRSALGPYGFVLCRTTIHYIYYESKGIPVAREQVKLLAIASLHVVRICLTLATVDNV